MDGDYWYVSATLAEKWAAVMVVELEARRTDAAWNALCRSHCVIEFGLDGTILWANGAFLQAMGYKLDEIVGEHHRIFCDPEYASSREYASFWRGLDAGKFHSGQYRRVSKSGAIVHLQASYNPVMNEAGRPERILKIAADVTVPFEQSEKIAGELQHQRDALTTAMDRLAKIVSAIGAMPRRRIFSHLTPRSRPLVPVMPAEVSRSWRVR